MSDSQMNLDLLSASSDGETDKIAETCASMETDEAKAIEESTSGGPSIKKTAKASRTGARTDRSQVDAESKSLGANETSKNSRTDITEEITSSEPFVFSVTDLNSQIRSILEGTLGVVWVRGEISNFKPHTSGHHYFSLKDEGAQISAVMFRGHNSKLKFRPENGLEVLVRGKITVYEPRGNYQIVCDSMEPVGAGALQKAFEQLKSKLQAEGLFDVSKKRAIPTFPRHIGIVTSPTGAAIRDILNVLNRRFKAARITLAPAQVQGEAAAASIVKAIELMNKLNDVDVLIVGRGGGSIEDMWCFNTEIVARSIASSKIPVISAVGHEIDFTIADFVADLRAPTPSAAAELVAKSASELSDRVSLNLKRLLQATQTFLMFHREKVIQYSKRLVDPKRVLQDWILRCDELSTRLEAAISRYLRERRTHVQLAFNKMPSPKEALVRLQKRLQLAHQAMANASVKTVDRMRAQLGQSSARLDAMSPLRVVARGYSIVETKTGQVVTRANQVSKGDKLKLRLAEGSLSVSVETTEIEK